MTETKPTATKTKIGDRVGAILCEHGNSTCFLGYGVYEGHHLPPNPGPPVPNPRIKLDNGSIVWGFQCWWGPEEKIKERLKGRWVRNVKLDAHAPLPMSPNPIKPKK